MKGTAVGIFVDDRVEKTIYEKAFQRLEHKVDGHVFTNPEEGLEAARTTKFDVVFIEIHYWGENFGGISILQQLKKITGKDFLAIALTSFLQEGDLEKIIEGGFSMCIEKPMAVNALTLFASGVSQNVN